jgi:L,D-peptidoglycan transpeptidase YkuD (ErfK/YbiS/YcfS/YnhG family)
MKAFSLLLGGLLVALLSAGTAPTPIPAGSRQLIRVLSDSWSAVPARLQRFERRNAQSSWQPIGREIPVVVGKKGMGWGRGLHPVADASTGEFRKEGDKRAPAGIFSLGSVFGIARPAEVSWLRMPYQELTASIRCIGANESQHYNRLVDLTAIKKDWHNDSDNEDMRRDAIRDEAAYRWGLVVNHNTPDTDRVSGSCIFIHLWKGDGSGTSGCTALSGPEIENLIRWLDANKQPLLVQLPQPEYQRLRARWQLP